VQSSPQFDTQSIHQKVREFRYKMGLKVSLQPRLLTWEEVSFYARFINEESSEFLKAHEDNDIVGASDALADLVYLLVGAAQMMGLPFDKILAAVHKANMDKVPGASKRHKEDVAKPYNWTGPEQDIRALLGIPPLTNSPTKVQFFNE
jgi:predicted HAD superfamily Cof-like phosphohydrolase